MALKNLTMQDLPRIDAAVETHASQLTREVDRAEARRRKVMNMTPGERRKWERDQQRNTVTFDLPVAISERLRAAAERYGVPLGHVAALWLMRGEQAVTHEEITKRRIVSPSPRFQWFLDLSDAESDK